MTMRATAIEQVIQVTTKVADGQLTGREAVTILATLTRAAVKEATLLHKADPERAAAYGELVLAIGRELRGRENESKRDEAHHLHAVTDDLAEILNALQ